MSITRDLSFDLPRPARRAVLPLSARLGLWRQRRQLAALEAHRLADIGLTAKEAAREAARPVWDAPSTWLR